MAEEDNQNTSEANRGEQKGVSSGEHQPADQQEDLRHPGLKRLLGISLPITVELGRVRLTVEELLRLGNGSVIELEKMAGEPAELYVRDAKFARGEVVVVDDNFGLRITEIIEWQECPDGFQS